MTTAEHSCSAAVCECGFGPHLAIRRQSSLPSGGNLAAIAVFCNEVKGKRDLALLHDLNCPTSQHSSCCTSGVKRWRK